MLAEVVPLLFGLDVLRGHLTIFPIPLAEAALFDPPWKRTVGAAATEAASDGTALTILGADDGRHRFRRESIAAAPWARHIGGLAGH